MWIITIRTKKGLLDDTKFLRKVPLNLKRDFQR
jgi:hypothetical protein